MTGIPQRSPHVRHAEEELVETKPEEAVAPEQAPEIHGQAARKETP
jgi:hypothetical protein